MKRPIGDNGPFFTLYGIKTKGFMMQRVVFHIPHDGTARPDELMKSVCVSKEVFEFYQEKMQDNDVSRLVPYGYESICFKISRLLCDVERFCDDSEPMEKYGMGFCYEKAYDGTVIKTVTEQLKKDTMKYYAEHHRIMDNLVCRNSIFLIDLHSFTDDIVVNCAAQPPFPDICIGYEDKYCDLVFVRQIIALFKQAGYSVSLNTPYSGSFVPNIVIQNSSGMCSSMMIEINKRVYRSNGMIKQTEVNRLQTLLGQIALKAERYHTK